MDFYCDQNGDIKVNPTGDVGLTENSWRNDAQQAYIRCMTEVGDYTLYPGIGADLTRLIGMPQSRETGQYGSELIKAALEREGRFTGRGIEVKAIPEGPQTIRFDIYIVTNSIPRQILSVQQGLNIS